MTQSSLPALLQERASQEPHATAYTSEGEVFIVGCMKDLLIVYGRNHYPEDIEATVKEITGGRSRRYRFRWITPRSWSPSSSLRAAAIPATTRCTSSASSRTTSPRRYPSRAV
jgi:acyl-CoA synthetase (AMP-forming)/AMP-acid ligase II